MTRDELINDYWNGLIGDFELVEIGFTIGMGAHEVIQVMALVRAEDGTL